MEEAPKCALFEGTIDRLIDEHDNKNMSKTDRDVSLLKRFLQRKVELRNIIEIPLAQLTHLPDQIFAS